MDNSSHVQYNEYKIYSYLKIIDADLKYILLSVVCKIFYAVDI